MFAHELMQQQPLRIVLVDDHTIVRTALARLLDEHADVELVGEAGDVQSAIETVHLKRPDIVVLDIMLGSDNALDAIPELLGRMHRPKILILSMHDEPCRVREAFAAGALGYLLKEAAESDLLDAIRTLNRGERYVHPTLGARLAQAGLDAPMDPLTDRERDVIRLLALGHTNQEVADLLYVSIRTVETHRSRAIGKLGVNSRAEMVSWALDIDLIGTKS